MRWSNSDEKKLSETWSYYVWKSWKYFDLSNWLAIYTLAPDLQDHKRLDTSLEI